jgi:hypothetical protein
MMNDENHAIFVVMFEKYYVFICWTQQKPIFIFANSTQTSDNRKRRPNTYLLTFSFSLFSSLILRSFRNNADTIFAEIRRRIFR